MGNREDLLTAAKACLTEKGYARTSARDIATAAGVSLAAIGYHYGTKEALLQAAIQQALQEWGDDLARTLTDAPAGDDPAERFAALWTGVVESFAAGRALWAVQFEVLGHLERAPELRQLFADAHGQARAGLVELFGGAPEGQEQRVGALYQVLLAGLAAIWLADPEGVPSGPELVAALRDVVTALGGPA